MAVAGDQALWELSKTITHGILITFNSMNWTDYIEVNKKVGFGKPVIKGTRISVEFIVGLFASGWSENQILENYPSLNKTHLQAVFNYLNSLLKDEMVFDLKGKSAS